MRGFFFAYPQQTLLRNGDFMNKNSTNDNLIISLNLLKELFNVNIQIINSINDIDKFVEKFHFHNAQTAITIDNINRLISDYDEIIYLTDCFLLHYIILKPEQQPVIIGPFCSMLLSTNDVNKIFNNYHINDITIKDFFSYYNSLPVLTEKDAFHITDSLLSVLGIDNLPKIRRINNISVGYSDEDFNDIKRKNNIQMLEKRYYYEQRFIIDIENGNSRSALLDLHNMQADVKYLKQIGTTMEIEKVAAAITRTTVRLAAMKAGLPIYIIDTLSRKNTIATSNSKSVDEILFSKENMIRDFCNAIRANNNNNYSALVQSILYYFEHNYYKDINLEHLSTEIALSKKHIISEFKKETHTTPMTYLKKLRLRQASILLSGTNMKIQDVCSSVGIPDANYFIKEFKKEYGVTPHSYRKNFI